MPLHLASFYSPSSFLACSVGRSPSIVDGTWNVTAGAVVDGGDAVRRQPSGGRNLNGEWPHRDYHVQIGAAIANE